jgi:hypothetical protein
MAASSFMLALARSDVRVVRAAKRWCVLIGGELFECAIRMHAL